MKIAKAILVSIALTAGLIVAQTPANAATIIGTIAFDNQSSALDQRAKSRLNTIKTKISTRDTVTATGYLRNHAGNPMSIGLARANAVKTYLQTLGVKATIKVVNGGVPKRGGSGNGANGVTITRVIGSSGTATGSFKVTFNLNGKKLDVGTVPPSQTATKTKPVVTKPMGAFGSGTTYSPNGDWRIDDWSETPTGPAIKWTFLNNVGWAYKPTKNTTLYAKWKLNEFFFYGEIHGINLQTQPLQSYRILTGDYETGLTSDTNWANVNLGQNSGSVNARFFPILDAPVKANMKFVFPDHNSGKVDDYTIYFDAYKASYGTPFDFSTVPGSFVHDEVNHLNYYYYWYQPSGSQQTFVKVIDNKLVG